MKDNKYNGWTNYETWRVNLECFDGWEENLEPDEARQMIEGIIEEDTNGFENVKSINPSPPQSAQKIQNRPSFVSQGSLSSCEKMEQLAEKSSKIIEAI